MSEFNVWSYLARMGVSVKGPASRTLAEGDRQAGMTAPTLVTLDDIEEFLHTDYEVFSCQAPGCTKTFSQLIESELHYNAVHRHSCSVCRKSLPSPHLLELHIQESHDSFFAVMSERKASYQCFLPTCPQVTWSPEERHEHVVEEHKFPPDFRFDEVKKKTKPASANGNGLTNGSAKVKQRPKKKQSEVNGNNSKESNLSAGSRRQSLSLARMGEHFKADNNSDQSMEVDASNNERNTLSLCPSEMTQSPSTPVSDPKGQDRRGSSSSTGKKSRIPVRSNSCRVPKNLSFGAGIPRGFARPKVKKKHWYQASSEDVSMDTATNIETSDLSGLRDSLPS